ncbi:hypothetical protein B0H14DRAFT_2620661 [Mycena olivaceomarginata]|nr:hypothetical protein B0H14DRAFT_2620661 [Mycena olivaceomarginata]
MNEWQPRGKVIAYFSFSSQHVSFTGPAADTPCVARHPSYLGLRRFGKGLTHDKAAQGPASHQNLHTALERQPGQRLALSTYDMILLISVDSNAQSWMKMQGTALAELLLGGPMFVGFGIAHITLQIYCDIRAHFSNTIISRRSATPRLEKLGHRLSCLLKINCCGMVEVGMNPVSEKWLYRPGSRQYTLAVHKPKEISNDFIQGVMTAEGMKLENAQYQNSVQESSDFSQQVLIRPYDLVLFGYNTYM